MMRPLRALCFPAVFAGLFLCAGLPAALAQDQAQAPPPPMATEHNESADHASAYYNFSMGHMYADLAQTYNRQDYLTKAIDYYKQALKLDPSISFINEELTDLYIQSGQLNKAVTDAEELLKQKPDDLGARRILGRVYTRMIGDPEQGKIDEKMLKLSIEQYSKIVEKDPDDTESELLLARLYRLSRDTASAEKTYNTVLAKEPDNDEALTGLAAILADRGDAKAAIDQLKRASEQNPSPRTIVMLATLYQQNKQYSEAADAWQQALQIAPDNDRWKRELAQDLLFSDRTEEARKIYEEIASEDPKDTQVQLRLSEIYLQQRDFVKARAALDIAKKAEPDNIDVRYDEVFLLDAEGKTDDAIKTLKAILDSTKKATYSTAEQAQQNSLEERLGLLYRSAGRYQDSIGAFRAINSTDADIAARAEVQVIETLRQSKDAAGAKHEMDSALKRYPKNHAVVFEYAKMLSDENKVDQAVSELNTLKDGKNDREILLAAAQFYEKAKRYGDEEKLLTEAAKLSTTKSDRIAVMFIRGEMLEKRKDLEGAESQFRDVLKEDPNNAGALNFLGYMLADRNTRLEEAQQLITKALEIDPQNYAYMDSLGWVYYRQNRLDAAEDQLRRALAKMSTDATVHDHLGDVLLKQGKVREAISQWQASLKSWDSNSSDSDADPSEMAMVQRKLEDARVRIAKETHGQSSEDH